MRMRLGLRGVCFGCLVEGNEEKILDGGGFYRHLDKPFVLWWRSSCPKESRGSAPTVDMTNRLVETRKKKRNEKEKEKKKI